METASAQLTILDDSLTELLSCARFVTVLKGAGFTTIPSLVRRCLPGYLLENQDIPTAPAAGWGTSSGGQDFHIDVPDEMDGRFANVMLPVRTVHALTRMGPSRRRSVIAMMKSVDNFTGDFAFALLAATPVDERSDVVQIRRTNIQRIRKFARIEKRLFRLQARIGILSANHADNLVHLVVCITFVRSWIRNPDVLAWLRVRYPRHAVVLERIVATADATKLPGRPMKLPYSSSKPSAGSQIKV
jgi:hypothetical protein